MTQHLLDQRGEAYAQLVQYGKALQDYDKAIALKPYYQYYIDRAGAKSCLRRYSQAIDDYTSSIAIVEGLGIEDELTQAYILRATAYHRIAKDDMARNDLAKVTALYPDGPSVEELLMDIKGVRLKKSKHPEEQNKY